MNSQLFRDAVEGMHDCKAEFRETVSVEETYEGESVWSGDVYVFDLLDHPTAKVAYAWGEPKPDSENIRVFAVLQEGPVKTAADAVRASILKDYQEQDYE